MHKYMGGILVKHIPTRRVWRLTGEHRTVDGQEMYEGKWPD